MPKVDLSVLLDDEISQSKKLPTLQRVVDWSIQLGNFAELLEKMAAVNGRINMPYDLMAQFVYLTNTRFSATVTALAAEYAKRGKSTVVDVDVEPTNIPVELKMADKDSVLTTKEQLN